MNNIEAIIGILLVIAVLFYGYRIKRIAFAIIWFVLGYAIIKNILPASVEGEFLRTLAPVCGGLLLALIGISIERLAVFATVAVTAYSIASASVSTETWAGVGICIAIAIIAGAIAVAIMKPAIIVATAAAAAHVISLSLVGLLGLAHHPYYLILLVAIAAIGAAYQFKSTKHL
jgi:hypothetical protein